MAAERGTSDKTEATRQCAHEQRSRLEAEDCDRTANYTVGVTVRKRVEGECECALPVVMVRTS